MEVDEEERNGEDDDDAAPSLRNRKGEETRDAERRDRQQPFRHARKSKRWQRVPDRRVERRVGAERQHDRHHGSEPENRGERIAAGAEQENEPEDRDDRGGPPEEDELFAARVIDVPRDEVARAGGIEGDLVERAAARLG